MKALTDDRLLQFFAQAHIDAADPERRIGRQLTFKSPARRTLVVHFGPDDPSDYIAEVMGIVLSSASSWLLVARHGPAAQLGDLTDVLDAEGLLFERSEHARLCHYLCTRDMRLGSVSVDVYLVSGDGSMLVTWDHHTDDEGLSIEVQDVERSSALLTALNDRGVELEVFYVDR
jgi:glycerate-2-kinase